MHAHVNCRWLLVRVILWHPELCAARTCTSTNGSMDGRAIWYILPILPNTDKSRTKISPSLGIPITHNCDVVRTDSHFMVSWKPALFVPPVCIAHITTNCRVVGSDDNFMVASALHYPYNQLWVPKSKVYLLHTAPIHP